MCAVFRNWEGEAEETVRKLESDLAIVKKFVFSASSVQLCFISKMTLSIFVCGGAWLAVFIYSRGFQSPPAW